ncbi:MAG: hypothetical protein K2F77_08290 [Muribaculaceae bacterium]|nr:hypothetical protein [Muribaculaceae bacterium]
MKHYINRLMLFAAMTAAAVAGNAQHTASGYFVDEYTYRYQMNPALGNERGFVTIPAIGNLNMGVHGNLHLNSVLYNVDGRTTTFMNPAISAATVMGNLHDVNRIGTSENITLLAAGFKAFGGYNTLTIGARLDVDAHLPKSIFSLLKEGVRNTTYDISDLGVYGNAYAELALGHSHNINKNLRVGGALKVLIGGGNVKANLRDARLTLGENDWTITTDADIMASVKGLSYKTTINNHTGHTYVDGVDVDDSGINGVGIAFDLGAEYITPVKGLTVSAAFLDLGFISWKNNMLASTDGVKTFHTDRYTFNPDDTFDNEWDKMRDDLSAIYELEDMGDQGGRTAGLHATMNVGASYELPVYRKLQFGLLNTTRIGGDYSWTDFRLSANVAPCRAFSAGVNMSAGTYGMGFGWLLNLHVTGFNFFLGMDRMPGKLAKQGVPLNSNMAVNLVMNVLF